MKTSSKLSRCDNQFNLDFILRQNKEKIIFQVLYQFLYNNRSEVRTASEQSAADKRAPDLLPAAPQHRRVMRDLKLSTLSVSEADYSCIVSPLTGNKCTVFSLNSYKVDFKHTRSFREINLIWDQFDFRHDLLELTIESTQTEGRMVHKETRYMKIQELKTTCLIGKTTSCRDDTQLTNATGGNKLICSRMLPNVGELSD